MSKPSTIYTSPTTFQKSHNHNDNRSKVQETARKFDMLGKSNNLPSSPTQSHHSSVAINVNNNHTNEPISSSISSSNDSITSEYVVNPSSKVRRRSRSNEPQIFNPSTQALLTKPHISRATIEIRSPLHQKPTPNHRRTPPPTPRNPLRIKQDNQSVYINGDHDFHEMDNQNDMGESESFPSHAEPMLVRQEIQLPSTNENIRSKLRSNSYRNGIENSSRLQNQLTNSDTESIGLEITSSPIVPQRRVFMANGHLNDNPKRISSIYANCEATEIPERSGTIPISSRRLPPSPPPPPPPAFAKPFLQKQQQYSLREEPQSHEPKRSLPFSNFMIELGALFIVFILAMVLALAIRENETELRTTMQLVYTYVYVVSLIWMIWCTFDIIKFRRQWVDLTSGAHDYEEYMDITERHAHTMSYFPDVNNTGGLFMRIGAGLLCMGGLILTVIEIAKTITSIGDDKTSRAVYQTYSLTVLITKIISYTFRFLFHCVQYSFLFRYGNIVINRYHLAAKIGLLHVIIANFCTWFEAIVYETLEQIHSHPTTYPTTIDPMITTTTATNNDTNDTFVKFFEGMIKASADSGTGENASTLDILKEIEATLGVYLYPCLIEYSLISLTVFFIMWRNVGKTENRSYLRFGDRHIFTVNCSRASRGLLIGGIIFLLTIITLIPSYLFEDYATSITHITRLVLLSVSLLTVCLSYFYTTKLFYDEHAHVDIFDQALILITTVGDFAYSFFGLFAFIFLTDSQSQLPVGVEISMGFLAIFQTFLQSGYIMDTLKRRTTTKQENRSKPGRETITALLLMNLAIWMHDSFSAKKVRLNPSQVAYYQVGTWSIIQAFTSPLSIFYRFHSSVCLADIWQEVYHDHGHNDGTRSGGKNRMLRLVTMNSGHDNQN